jgi:hypothetical protein
MWAINEGRKLAEHETIMGTTGKFYNIVVEKNLKEEIALES